VIRDKKTGDILENALVSLIGSNNEVIDRKVVFAGLYEFDERDCSNTKFIRAEKNGYLTKEEMIEQPIKEGVVNQDLLLDKREIAITAGTNIGRALLNPVYFDLNSSYIRPDAAIELQKIIAVMQQNPSLAIDVRSHTDSRANDHYNMWLSDRRVRRTINYIVSHGNISRDRLTGRGYGETQLVNRCSNGVECSESIHQENRRSEFIIME
jgi:outer membrane protein OmpA-like peptidoglycan-associated protein